MIRYKRDKFILPLLLSLSIFLIACLPYFYVLNLSFTGIDTVPTIASARIDSIGQIYKVFSRELRGGIADSSISYYRPLTLATYSLDYLIWGWKPIGYHITDLILHGFAAIAVFWMTLIAFERKTWEAFLVSLIFMLHPATIEVVPAISRRQEPLLMIGCAVALTGAHALPRKSAWLAVIVGSLISITSVERGLVIPGILFFYIFFLRYGLVKGNNPSIKDQFFSAIKYTIPVALLAIIFYVFRTVMFQSSGIFFSLRNLVTTPIFFLVAVLYPQQFIPLHWPKSIALIVLSLITGYFLIMAVLVIFWKSKQKRLYLALSMWISLFIAIIAIAGQNLSWYTYTIVVPASIILVSMLGEGVKQIRYFGKGRLFGYLNIFLSTIFILLIVTASPTFRNYNGWSVASQQTQTILDDTLTIIESAPENTNFVFINIPSHYKENNTDFLVTKSAAILWPYSLQAWFDIHQLQNKVVVLGSSTHDGVIRVPEIEFTESKSLKIYFNDPDSFYYNSEYGWPPQEFGNEKFLVYIYDGTLFREDKELEVNNGTSTQ